MVKVFKYVGAFKNGLKQKGIVIAETKDEAISILERRGIYVSKLKEVNSLILKILPVNYEHLALVFEGLAQMISAGIPQDQAIENLIREQFNPKLAYILYLVKENILKGASLPDAFGKTGYFSNDVVKMLEVGIESGRIVDILYSLGDYYRNIVSLKKSVKSASIYPAVVLVIIILFLLFGLPKIVNPMKKFYAQFEGRIEFPAISQFIVDSVNWLSHYSIFIFLTLIIIVFAFSHQYKNNRSFKRRIDNLILMIPITKTFMEKLTIYKFLLNFSVLVKAGVPVVDAFKLISQTMGNEIAREEFEKGAEYLKKGYSLERVIKLNRFLTNRIKSILSIGIETGKLDENLEQLRKFEKENFDAYISFLKNLSTPVLMVIIGFIVAVVIISVYLPMFELFKLLKTGMH